MVGCSPLVGKPPVYRGFLQSQAATGLLELTFQTGRGGHAVHDAHHIWRHVACNRRIWQGTKTRLGLATPG